MNNDFQDGNRKKVAMNCISTPLNDDHLLAALSGDADPETLQHLEACAACRGRLEHLRAVENRLSHKLQRRGCPSMMQLQNLFFDLLDEPEREAVAGHVKGCLDCQADLEEMRGFLGQPALKRVVKPRDARPRRNVLHPATPPPAFALRGEIDMKVLVFDGITLILEVQEDAGRYTLRGQLTGSEVARWENALVEVQQESAQPTLGIVDENGRFQCALAGAQPARLSLYAQDKTMLVIEKIDFVT
jgi:hypothetical protein